MLDNASGHDLSDSLPGLVVEPLPPNTTSKHQPCDQGIIDASMSMHKREMMGMLKAFEERLDKTPDESAMREAREAAAKPG